MKKLYTAIAITILFYIFASQCIAKQGCCSHHNGVCGCRRDRALCCDNTVSPSCSCD